MTDVAFIGHRCANPAGLADEFISGAYEDTTEAFNRLADFVVNNEGQIAFDPANIEGNSWMVEAKHMVVYDKDWVGEFDDREVIVYVYNPNNSASITMVNELIANTVYYDQEKMLVVAYIWPSNNIIECASDIDPDDPRINPNVIVCNFGDQESVDSLRAAVTRKRNELYSAHPPHLFQ